VAGARLTGITRFRLRWRAVTAGQRAVAVRRHSVTVRRHAVTAGQRAVAAGLSLAVFGLGIILLPSPAAAAICGVVNGNHAGPDHCYGYRTWSPPYAVAQVSGYARIACQSTFSAYTGVTTELWKRTPNRLAAGETEWNEVGITSGTFTNANNGVTSYVSNQFFWARYYKSAPGVGTYEERLVVGTASTGVDHYVMIRYNFGNGLYEIFIGSTMVAAEGMHTAPARDLSHEAGGEYFTQYDGSVGTVSGLAYALQGDTSSTSGWPGSSTYANAPVQTVTFGNTHIRSSNPQSAYWDPSGPPTPSSCR
jgi:hypothetical protein